MATKSLRIRQTTQRQLDERFSQIREHSPLLLPPRGGWIQTIRAALGMTQAQLANRMGVSRQAVTQLEVRESEGSTTLRALEEAAEALGGKLVYGIVPNQALSEMLQQRAEELAGRWTRGVRHTMRLEDQEPETDLDRPTQELIDELLASPGRLWETND